MDLGFRPEAFEEVIVAGSTPQQAWEGVDVYFDDVIDFADEVAYAMYSKGFATSGGQQGTSTQVRDDVRCITYYTIAKRGIQELYDTEGRYTKLTAQITKSKIHVPKPIATLVSQLGAFTHEGRSFKPRDLETIVIRALFYAMHYGADERTRGYNDATRGNINHVDFKYLDFNDTGEIREKRSRNLFQRIRNLARAVLNVGEDTAVGPITITLAQRILEVSSFDELIGVEQAILRNNVLTQAEIDACNTDLGNHGNANHRDAVRNITGHAAFDAANGTIIQPNALRGRLGVLQTISNKIHRDYQSVYMFVILGPEGGSTPMLVGYESLTGILSSVIQMSVKDVGTALVGNWAVSSLGPNRKSDDGFKQVIKSIVANDDVIH